jgi:RNA polymerase subunit RPABC4/transcription elongation factor Spt4
MAIETVLARGAQLLIALSGAYLAVLWFVTIVWTFRDIESRSRNVVTQVFATLLAILFPFIGIPLYLILRPKDTLDGAFQRSLEEEYLLQDLEELPLCPSCQHFVEDDFVLCPHCHTQLRDACPSCARLVDLRWTVCPYCAADQGDQRTDGRTPVAVPAARWAAPRTALRRGVGTPADPTPAPAVPDVAATSAGEEQDRPAVAALSLLPSTRVVARGTEQRNGRDHQDREVAPSSTERLASAVHGARKNGQAADGRRTTAGLLLPRRGRFQPPVEGNESGAVGGEVPAATPREGPTAAPVAPAVARVEGD